MIEESPPDLEADFDRFHRAERSAVVAYMCNLGFSHHIADEAASEAMEKLYWSWFKVRTNRRMWVRTTARRIAVRKANAERSWLYRWSLASGLLLQSDYDPSLGAVVERHGGLVQAINSLPENERFAFALHLEGFSAKEIAAASKVSERTAQRHIQQARCKLRAILGEEKR